MKKALKNKEKKLKLTTLGFTLIELLAVIIIFAVIALIATPSIINVINTAKNKADLESVHGILDGARLYYSESMMNNDKKTNIENLNNIYDDVNVANKPDNGSLYINEKGLTAIAIVIRNKCYTKQFSGDIVISEDIENCTLGYVGIDTTAPTVNFNVLDGTFNINGWANSNFNVNITISDSESGPSSYKYCIDTTICTPSILVDSATGFSEISSNSETNNVCVIGIDNYGNESDVICSDDYKLDSVIPTLTEVTEDITITQGDSNLVSSYFNEPTYGISSGTLSCSPENTNSLSTGTQTVSCTAISNSGLSITTSKDITVNASTFSLTYGGSNGDATQSAIVQTTDGGYILTGYTNSTDGDITDGNNGGNDILVMKLNSTGQLEWNKTYGGTGNDYGDSIIQTTDGGYILIGFTNSTNGDITDGNNGGNDILVMKLSNTGEVEWNKTYGGTGDDIGISIIETTDGNYVIAGNTLSNNGDITDGNNGCNDVLIMKISNTGAKLWNKTYGSAGEDTVYSIIETTDGGYILTGYSELGNYDITDGNNGGYDVLVIKTNSSGIMEWNKTYGGTGSDIGTSIMQEENGDYIIFGYTSSNDYDITDGNNGSYDMLIMRISNDGTKIWDKTYGGSNIDHIDYAIKTTDDNYIVVGYTNSNNYDITDGNNGQSDLLIMKIDNYGSKIWDKTYGGSGNDYGFSIIETINGGYIVVSNTSSNDYDITDGNNGNTDIWILKTNSNFEY